MVGIPKKHVAVHCLLDCYMYDCLLLHFQCMIRLKLTENKTPNIVFSFISTFNKTCQVVYVQGYMYIIASYDFGSLTSCIG